MLGVQIRMFSKENFSSLGIKSDPLVKKYINLLMRDGKRCGTGLNQGFSSFG